MTHVFTIIFCMLLAKVTASQTENFCPAGWLLWEKSCYKSLYPLISNWQDAFKSCQDLGANLGTPNSREEYDFIWGTFWSSTSEGVWIGCTDEDGDKVWKCIGDTQVKYRARWHSAIRENETCAVMSTAYPKWKSWKCNVERHMTCERPIQTLTKTVTCSIVATDHGLFDHIFKTITVRGRLQCCLACHNDHRCSSFNLRGNQCELIDSTDAEDHLSEAVSCNYYTL